MQPGSPKNLKLLQTEMTKSMFITLKHYLKLTLTLKYEKIIIAARVP